MKAVTPPLPAALPAIVSGSDHDEKDDTNKDDSRPPVVANRYRRTRRLYIKARFVRCLQLNYAEISGNDS